jgi:plastocyanin domain-containing protein
MFESSSANPKSIRRKTMCGKTIIATIMMLLVVSITLPATFRAAPEGAAKATPQNEAQTATVEVTDKGFEPSSLKLKAGAPAKVTFVRKTDQTCAKEVVIKEYNIDRKIPLNEPVRIEFTPRKGEFTFACGMDMIKGKLIVE